MPHKSMEYMILLNHTTPCAKKAINVAYAPIYEV
jgi:hypothetical protein